GLSVAPAGSSCISGGPNVLVRLRGALLLRRLASRGVIGELVELACTLPILWSDRDGQEGEELREVASHVQAAFGECFAGFDLAFGHLQAVGIGRGDGEVRICVLTEL